MFSLLKTLFSDENILSLKTLYFIKSYLVMKNFVTKTIFEENSSTYRLCLVHVKHFSENKYFLEMQFSGKENVFRLFGCLGIRFTENQFRCLVRSNILRKMLSVLRKNQFPCLEFVFYGKSIPMFGLWIILQKI